MLGVEVRVNRQRHRVRAMGSRVDLLAADAPAGSVRWAIARVRELERCWTRFDQASELCELNRRAGTGPQPASADLRQAVARALRLWQATDGLFDPSTLAALESAGYDRSFRTLATAATAAERRPAAGVPGVAGVIVDDDAGSITVPAGVRLDLGGVGKGLAADLLAQGLVERGARGACVSVGGDVAVAGRPGGGERQWVVPVEDPFEDGLVRWEVPLARGAIAQSSRLVRRWVVAGEERHHLIDPRTGEPARSGLAAAVVVADEAWWAEGVAKAALIAGPLAGAALIGRLARGGWLVRDDGAVTMAGGSTLRRAS